jgi:hypothetical protein
MFVNLVFQSFHPVEFNYENIALYKVLNAKLTLYTVQQEEMELIFTSSWSFKMTLNFPGINKQYY